MLKGVNKIKRENNIYFKRLLKEVFSLKEIKESKFFLYKIENDFSFKCLNNLSKRKKRLKRVQRQPSLLSKILFKI